jgi:type IV pilus biogenesis protein PilP
MNTCTNLRRGTFVKMVAVAFALMSSGAFAATAANGETASEQSAPTSSAPSTYQLPTWTTYYATVDAIRADTQKAQAELDNLQIHHQLDDARHGKFSHDGDKAATSAPAAPTMMNLSQASPSAPTAAHVTRDPLVQGVSMVDNRWTAIVQLSSGARVPVHEGEAVRGLGTVVHIALGEVLVSQGGKVTALAFAGDGAQEVPPTNTSTAPTVSGGMSMPMPMPSPISMH